MQQLRVWSVLAAMAALASALVLGGAHSAAGLAGLPRLLTTPTSSTAAELCLGLAGVGSVLGGAWLGLVTTVAALDHRRSRPPRPRSGALRPHVVQALVGATLTCVGTQPAVAAGPGAADQSPPLPLRPVTAPTEAAHVEPPRARSFPPATVRVRPGDALWTIAADLAGPGADDAEIDRTWRVIYADNRERIGDEPDLLHPGTTLTVPDLGSSPVTNPATRPARSRHP